MKETNEPKEGYFIPYRSPVKEKTTLADKKEYYIQKGIKRYYYPAEDVNKCFAKLQGALCECLGFDFTCYNCLTIDELTGDLK